LADGINNTIIRAKNGVQLNFGDMLRLGPGELKDADENVQ
jgi:hypothetical protein